MNRRNLITTMSMGGLAAGLLAAGGAPASAASQRNQYRLANKLLDKMEEAINKHDVSLLDQVYAADGYTNNQVLVTMGGNGANTKMGRDQAKNYFAARFKAFPDVTLKTDIRVGFGDLIAANLVWAGTHEDTYLGIAATHKKVAWNSTDILRVRNGFFIEHWGAVDFYGLVKQLQA